MRLELPLKTERVVLAANGTQRAVGGDLDGWYRGQSLPLIGWNMVLAANAIVRFEASKIAAHGQRANGGWANTRDLVRAARVVTRFDRVPTSIAVAIDDVDATNAAAEVHMTLVGALRTAGTDGRPIEPIVLVQGMRSVLVYDVEPLADPEALDPNVTVVIERCRQRPGRRRRRDLGNRRGAGGNDQPGRVRRCDRSAAGRRHRHAHRALAAARRAEPADRPTRPAAPERAKQRAAAPKPAAPVKRAAAKRTVTSEAAEPTARTKRTKRTTTAPPRRGGR